jgi:hypothetical protein
MVLYLNFPIRFLILSTETTVLSRVRVTLEGVLDWILDLLTTYGA